MSKHTPEPWEAEISYNQAAIGIVTASGRANTIGQRPNADQRWTIAVLNCAGVFVGDRLKYSSTDEQRANRDRIVACVNACAGINPEAVPSLLKACEALIADYNECISASEFGDGPIAEQLLETLKAELAKTKGTGDA